MKFCCPRFSELMLAMLLGAAIFAGGWFWGTRQTSAESDWTNALIPASLRADATSEGKLMTVATGWVDNDVEGVFVLDHLTGNLQCWVLNSRSGEIGGLYRGNVLEALGVQGKSDLDFVMVTGRFDFTNFRQGNYKYAPSICYVGESSSGKIVGYGFTFDPTMEARGEPQMGDLIPIANIPFRDETILRD
jgi:hypothetical protein